MGQVLRDVIVSPEVDDLTYWVFRHEGLIMLGLGLFILAFVALMIFILVKVIKKEERKKAAPAAGEAKAAADNGTHPEV